MVAMAVADSGYAYLTVARSYETGHLIDIVWVASYLAVAVGASQATHGAEVADVHLPVLGGPPLTPFLPILVALPVLAVDLSLGHHLDAVSWGSALVLVLSVLARLGPFAAHPRPRVPRAGEVVPTVGRL
jgi:hypothetical protein